MGKKINKIVGICIIFLLSIISINAVTYLYQEDFDRSDSSSIGGNWSEAESGAYATIVGEVMYLTDKGSGSYTVTQDNIGATLNSNTSIDFRWKMTGGITSTDKRYILFYDEDDKLLSYIRFGFTSGEVDTAELSNTQFNTLIASPSTDVYYNFSLRNYDKVAETYDIYIDDSFIVEAEFYQTMTGDNVDEIRLASYSATATNVDDYIDYFYICDGLCEDVLTLEVEIINITANGELFINNTVFETSDVVFNVTYNVTGSDEGDFLNSSITIKEGLSNNDYFFNDTVCYNSTCDVTGTYEYTIDRESVLTLSGIETVSNEFPFQFNVTVTDDPPLYQWNYSVLEIRENATNLLVTTTEFCSLNDCDIGTYPVSILLDEGIYYVEAYINDMDGDIEDYVISSAFEIDHETTINITSITGNGEILYNNTKFDNENVTFNVTYDVKYSDIGNFTNSTIISYTNLPEGTYYEKFEVTYDGASDSSINYTYQIIDFFVTSTIQEVYSTSSAGWIDINLSTSASFVHYDYAGYDSGMICTNCDGGTFESAPLPDGEYMLYVQTVNPDSYTEWNFTVDTTPPIINWDNEGQYITFDYNAPTHTADDGDIFTVTEANLTSCTKTYEEFLYNDSVEDVSCTSNFGFIYAGRYNVTVTATDGVGHVTTESSYFYVDKDAQFAFRDNFTGVNPLNGVLAYLNGTYVPSNPYFIFQTLDNDEGTLNVTGTKFGYYPYSGTINNTYNLSDNPSRTGYFNLTPYKLTIDLDQIRNVTISNENGTEQLLVNMSGYELPVGNLSEGYNIVRVLNPQINGTYNDSFDNVLEFNNNGTVPYTLHVETVDTTEPLLKVDLALVDSNGQPVAPKENDYILITGALNPDLWIHRVRYDNSMPEIYLETGRLYNLYVLSDDYIHSDIGYKQIRLNTVSDTEVNINVIPIDSMDEYNDFSNYAKISSTRSFGYFKGDNITISVYPKSALTELIEINISTGESRDNLTKDVSFFELTQPFYSYVYTLQKNFTYIDVDINNEDAYEILIPLQNWGDLDPMKTGIDNGYTFDHPLILLLLGVLVLLVSVGVGSFSSTLALPVGMVLAIVLAVATQSASFGLATLFGVVALKFLINYTK